MPIVYDPAIAEAMITESAEEFRDTFESHLADVILGISTDDWQGERQGIIDLESMIWALNERHGRPDDLPMGASKTEREAFIAVIRKVSVPLPM